MFGCCADLFRRPGRRRGEIVDDYTWKTGETNNNFTDNEDSSGFPGGLRPPVFYIDSGDSTDTDYQHPASDSRRHNGSAANPASSTTENIQMNALHSKRHDPNTALQKKSRLHNEKLPSFSALDRTRRWRSRRSDGSVESQEGEIRLIHEPLKFETFRSSSPPLAVIAPMSSSRRQHDESVTEKRTSQNPQHGTENHIKHQDQSENHTTNHHSQSEKHTNARFHSKRHSLTHRQSQDSTNSESKIPYAETENSMKTDEMEKGATKSPSTSLHAALKNGLKQKRVLIRSDSVDSEGNIIRSNSVDSEGKITDYSSDEKNVNSSKPHAHSTEAERKKEHFFKNRASVSTEGSDSGEGSVSVLHGSGHHRATTVSETKPSTGDESPKLTLLQRLSGYIVRKSSNKTQNHPIRNLDGAEHSKEITSTEMSTRNNSFPKTQNSTLKKNNGDATEHSNRANRATGKRTFPRPNNNYAENETSVIADGIDNSSKNGRRNYTRAYSVDSKPTNDTSASKQAFQSATAAEKLHIGVAKKVAKHKHALKHQTSCVAEKNDSVCAYHHGGFVNEGFSYDDDVGSCNHRNTEMPDIQCGLCGKPSPERVESSSYNSDERSKTEDMACVCSLERESSLPESLSHPETLSESHHDSPPARQGKGLSHDQVLRWRDGRSVNQCGKQTEPNGNDRKSNTQPNPKRKTAPLKPNHSSLDEEELKRRSNSPSDMRYAKENHLKLKSSLKKPGGPSAELSSNLSSVTCEASHKTSSTKPGQSSVNNEQILTSNSSSSEVFEDSNPSERQIRDSPKRQAKSKTPPRRPTSLHLPEVLSKNSFSSAFSDSTANYGDEDSTSRLESSVEETDSTLTDCNVSNLNRSSDKRNTPNVEDANRVLDFHRQPQDSETSDFDKHESDCSRSISNLHRYRTLGDLPHEDGQINMHVTPPQQFLESETDSQVTETTNWRREERKAKTHSQVPDSRNELSDSEPQSYTLKAKTHGNRSVCWSVATKPRRKPKTKNSRVSDSTGQNTGEKSTIVDSTKSRATDGTLNGNGSGAFPRSDKRSTFKIQRQQSNSKVVRVSDNCDSSQLKQAKEISKTGSQTGGKFQLRYTSSGRKIPPKKPKRKTAPSKAKAIVTQQKSLTSEKNNKTSSPQGDVTSVKHQLTQQGDDGDLSKLEQGCVGTSVNDLPSSSSMAPKSVFVTSCDVTEGRDVDSDVDKAVTWLCAPPDSFRDEDYADFESFDEFNGSLV